MSAHPLETYLGDCDQIRHTGANVPETSFYPALSNLLNEVGRHLKPRVRCVMSLANRGAGLPDGGLFSESQFKRRTDIEPELGQAPERGVIEVKSPSADLGKLVAGEQVARYWAKYRLVLVTDLREFILIGEDNGATVVRERYALAQTAAEFWDLARHPRKAAQEQGVRFLEFLRRVMLHAAPLVDPKDLAWFIASYACDARARVEQAQLPALEALRSALELALGLKFEGEKGEHFFRSTLVQTLFYGVFAAWVLWHRAGGRGRFDWHTAEWSLHVPMIRSLFEQLAMPSRLRPLGLEEPLDLTAAALSRVERDEFFRRFEDRHAVQYFYEPFLEAFDPELRKQLGVWYTPEEVVQYMVRRVDQVLVSELGIADGLADPQVYVLDPCCGTGAYLVEALRVIAERLKARGEDALAAQRVKRAMVERIFGFEILPAPFVVSHLQIGVMLSGIGAPLADGERAGVYLTNALSGWEPPVGAKQHLIFPELEAERDAADQVKRVKPILVILGNPPYNAFAGVVPGEERDLVEPYKRGLTTKWGIKKFNLDDLYVRFFRLAERQIAERTGRGVVCYISNFSYLSEPSFASMRAQLLGQFDRIWIDCLNGDSRETGKVAPDGSSDPSVFSTEYNREGIKKGTAIGLFVRRADHSQGGTARIGFREFWGVAKRTALIASLTVPDLSESYSPRSPAPENRLSFRLAGATVAYASWPLVTDLCGHEPLYGLNENRRGAMISIDRMALEKRMQIYLDPAVPDAEATISCGGLMKPAARFDPIRCRRRALAEHKFDQANIRRFAVAALDYRWCYWSPVRPMWNEPRPDLVEQHWEGNAFVYVRRFGRRPDEKHPLCYGTALPDLHLMDPDIVAIPLRWRSRMMGTEFTGANLSEGARRYLAGLAIADVDSGPENATLVWHHVLAIAFSPAWLEENGAAIRSGFPRVPLPASAAHLRESAALGARVSELLDPDSLVEGVTTGAIRPELQGIAVIARVGGGALDPAMGALGLTAGWGHAGREDATMPGKGRVETRAASNLPATLGAHVLDVYLNGTAYWRNVPEAVWDFTIGGYQVIKKWLSYRERPLLGRDLTIEEVEHVTGMARRIAAIVLLACALDENYKACAGAAATWPKA